MLKYAENLKETNLVYAENLNTYLSFARLTEFAIFSINGLGYFKDRETIVRRIYQFDGLFFVDTHKDEQWGKIIYD